jgi:hypothetical protein
LGLQEQELNKSGHRTLSAIMLFIVPVMGFLASVSLLAPFVREILIRLAETYVVHRSLTHPVWHERIREWAYTGFAFFLILGMVIAAFLEDIRKAIDLFSKRDLVSSIGQSWNKIPSLYKKSFCVVFLGLNIVFALHTAAFMIGNHDWGILVFKSPLVGELAIGRYFYNVFSFVLMSGRFLPVLTNLINFLFFSFAALMLCTYWKLPKSVLVYSVMGLLLVLQPYTIARMYGMAQGYYMTLPFFVLSGFFLGDKAMGQASKARRLGFVLLSTLSFWFALGTYAVVVSTIAVVSIGRLILEFISKEKAPKISKIALAHAWTILSIVIALCLHVIVVFHLREIGRLSADSYMTETVGLRDIPAKLTETAKASFRYLFEYRAPFFPRSFTLLFTVLFIVSLLAVSLRIFRSETRMKMRLFNIVIFIVLFYAALFFSFTANLITKTNMFFMARTDFFGIAYFHILIVAILFCQPLQFQRNISLLFCFVLIYISAISDFYAMKVWKLGFEAEKMEWNRIIARIETTDNYQDNKDYRLIILGSTRAYRPYFYDGKYNQEDLLDWPYMAPWSSQPVRLLHAYTAHSKDGLWYQLEPGRDPLEYDAGIRRLAGEIKEAEAWPSKKSIFIKDDIIFITFDKAELDRIKVGLNNGGIK